MNDPATIQFEQTQLTSKEGKYILVYYSNFRGRAMSLFHQIQQQAQHSPPSTLFQGYLPELGRQQHQTLPGFHTASPTNQKNYLEVLLGGRDPTSAVDCSLGPRISKPKSNPTSIVIDTSSDKFPDLIFVFV